MFDVCFHLIVIDDFLEVILFFKSRIEIFQIITMEPDWITNVPQISGHFAFASIPSNARNKGRRYDVPLDPFVLCPSVRNIFLLVE